MTESQPATSLQMEILPFWQQSPDIERMRVWATAFEDWKTTIKPSTIRAYLKAWQLLMVYADKMPWAVGKADVAGWVTAMKTEGLADTTRNLRIAAISSFYRYVCSDYTIIRPDGREVPLHDLNPAAGKSLRAKVNPYGKASYLSVQEVRALLRSIDRKTAGGLRDYALIMAYLFTGRRNTEVRTLTWGDLEKDGERVYYRWSGKGKDRRRFELPPPVWEAVQAWLAAAGRLEAMADGDYLFVPLGDHATRLPNVSVETYDPNHPLSLREANRLLKKYARLAGLDPTKLHIHILRHTAAMLRKQAGDDPEQIMHFLDQSSLATTMIYIDHLAGQEDKSWAKVESLLGL